MKDCALSANLGYLFTEYNLVDAIARAGEAGFKAVECQRPYHMSPSKIKKACEASGCPMLAINTTKGKKGQFGLSAIHDAIPKARQAIYLAIVYAKEIDVKSLLGNLNSLPYFSVKERQS